MPDYKELYFKLFSIQSKVIELLIQAGQETEELVMGAQESVQLMENAQLQHKEMIEQECKN